MTNEKFLSYLEGQIQRMKDMMGKGGTKAEAYHTANDALVHFRMAAKMSETNLPDACWGMLVKHLAKARIHIKTQTPIPHEVLDDLINYFFLLKMCSMEYFMQDWNEVFHALYDGPQDHVGGRIADQETEAVDEEDTGKDEKSAA